MLKRARSRAPLDGVVTMNEMSTMPEPPARPSTPQTVPAADSSAASGAGEDILQELERRGGARAGPRCQQLEGNEGGGGARAGSGCQQLKGVDGERCQPELESRGGARAGSSRRQLKGDKGGELAHVEMEQHQQLEGDEGDLGSGAGEDCSQGLVALPGDNSPPALEGSGVDECFTHDCERPSQEGERACQEDERGKRACQEDKSASHEGESASQEVSSLVGIDATCLAKDATMNQICMDFKVRTPFFCMCIMSSETQSSCCSLSLRRRLGQWTA